METKQREFLQALVAQAGPTGFEAPVVKAWCDYLKPYADEIYTDSYGNGFAVLNPQGDPCVMLTGHADEIGLMITYIDDNGFLWVGSLGGYDAKILVSMRVRVFGFCGQELKGVIGALPPHLQGADRGGKDIKRYRFGENVYIDIGAKNKKEAEKYVRVGDPIIVDYGYREMNSELATARGLDNKIGIWSAAEALRLCSEKKGKLAAKIVALATVQEEIGGYGASMGAFAINPDVAIAVDVTQSVDHPGTDKRKFGDHKLGLGPVLGHGSANHPVVVQRLEKVARKLRLDLQHEAAPRYTGTDGDSIYVTRAGIPTAVVAVSQRYMHSPAETLSLSDLEHTAQLLAGFCQDLKRGERFKVEV
jgi:putative aminopeptidase FrvX